MHTYDNRPCHDCGDLDGCHIPGKVKRHPPLRTLYFMADGGCGDQPCQERFVPFGKTDAREAKYGQTFPKVVCLCGSTRFVDAWKEAMRSETLEGNIVLSVGLHGHAEAMDMSGPMKAMLDELHKRKIDHADEILVLNCLAVVCNACGSVHAAKSRAAPHSWVCPCGHHITDAPLPYVGKSTRGEIEYALKHGKSVRYLEPQE